MVLVPMLLILVALIAVSYWHVYARPRVLSNHGVQATDKPVLEGAFQLVPEGIGSALSGIIVSQKEGWIINRVMVDVRIQGDARWDELLPRYRMGRALRRESELLEGSQCGPRNV